MVEVERAMGSLLLAWVVLLACLALMVWSLLGPAQRQRWRSRWQRLRQRPPRPTQQPRQPAPADPRQAQHEAEALIARARRAGPVQREGNVLRPERFSRRPGETPNDPTDDDEPRRPTLH